MVPEWTRPFFAGLLTFFCPPFATILVDTILNKNGSIQALLADLAANPTRPFTIWTILLMGAVRTWCVITAFIVLAGCLIFSLRSVSSAGERTTGDQQFAAVAAAALVFFQVVPVADILNFELPVEPSQTSTSMDAIKCITVFVALQLLLVRVLPGERFEGPITEHGNVPVYKVNGFKSFIATMVLFLLGARLGLYNGGILYDHYERIIAFMSVFALGFCALLSLKGLYFPTTSDCGTTGNLVTDYYWGTELYPRLLGWDVKTMTNCRFGMMLWPVLCTSYALKQFELNNHVSHAMLVSVGIQLVYVAKFFWWESGYWRSTDIHTDRAGFYICWGCLVWVPSMYTVHSLYLVKHSENDLSAPAALALFAFGVTSVFLNYWADEQRAHFRRVNGDCLIWGKKPVIIRAAYTTTKGETHTSLLLASGWWGIARHWHYVPELMAAFSWCAPAGGTTVLLPYIYFIFLTILLVDRSFRDDARCHEKYGKDWEKYKKAVPWRIVPYVL